jgi:hypothetical protein
MGRVVELIYSLIRPDHALSNVTSKKPGILFLEKQVSHKKIKLVP